MDYLIPLVSCMCFSHGDASFHDDPVYEDILCRINLYQIFCLLKFEFLVQLGHI